MMKNVNYVDGAEIQLGDILAPSSDVDGQVATVAAILATGKALLRVNLEDWDHIASGIVVEHRGASGIFYVGYQVVDDDFVLLRRGDGVRSE